MKEDIWSRHVTRDTSCMEGRVRLAGSLHLLDEICLHLVTVYHQEHVENKCFEVVHKTKVDNISASLV